MIKDENNTPNFVQSTLKVTASAELDIEQDLAAINDNHKTIDSLLVEYNDSKKE